MENNKNNTDENGNELITFEFTIFIPEDVKADDVTPTEECLKAAASTPILHTIAETSAIGKKARGIADDIAAAAQETARNIADGIISLSAEPTEGNKSSLVGAIAAALHIASTAAAKGIVIPAVKRYPVDVNANHFTAFFASAARAILAAHDDGRQEDEVYLSALFDDATSIIRRAAAHVPIRHADADAITKAIDELNEAVINT